MKLNDQQKHRLNSAIDKAMEVLSNAKTHVIEKDDPIVLGKRASEHTAAHLRKVVRTLEAIYKV